MVYMYVYLQSSEQRQHPLSHEGYRLARRRERLHLILHLHNHLLLLHLSHSVIYTFLDAKIQFQQKLPPCF